MIDLRTGRPNFVTAKNGRMPGDRDLLVGHERLWRQNALLLATVSGGVSARPSRLVSRDLSP